MSVVLVGFVILVSVVLVVVCITFSDTRDNYLAAAWPDSSSSQLVIISLYWVILTFVILDTFGYDLIKTIHFSMKIRFS